MKGKNVLVTGATGFTGGHLCRRLVREGARVRALVRPGRDASALESPGIEAVPGDLTDAGSLKDAVSGVQTVYHIGAAFRDEGAPRQRFWDVNVTGTQSLMDAALDAGVRRFVHCSTVGVQGEIQDPPADEEAPYNPGDHYQASKTDGERLVLQYIRERGLPGVIFRPVGIYGPGDTRFLKLFRHIASGRFRMIGSGDVLYHLTYIDDLVSGIVLCGTRPGIEGEIFTLGGPEYTTLNEFVRLVAGALDVPVPTRHFPVWPVWLAGAACEVLCRPFPIHPPIYRRRVDFFIKDRAFDISKARRVLGYEPGVDMKTGLRKTVEWYRSEGLLS